MSTQPSFSNHIFARRTAPVFLLALLVLLAGLACSSQSPNIGKFYKGRILHVSVADLQRTDELRWTTATRFPAQGRSAIPCTSSRRSPTKTS